MLLMEDWIVFVEFERIMTSIIWGFGVQNLFLK